MTGRHAILIVEDEGPIRALMVELFEHFGFEALEASNGLSAMTIIHDRPDIQAMLTDVNMPGKPDGLALARYVHARHSKCAIVVMSGYVQPKPGDLPSLACFIKKPFRGSRVVALINGLIARQAE